MTRLAILISTAGFLGYAPIAPGTVGSLAGLALWVAVRAAGTPGLELAIILAVTGVGVWSSAVAERHFRTTDPGPVVIDEVAGMLVTLAFTGPNWTGALAGFFVFRLFDIVKPYPASRLERLPGGVGIMADDLMVGVYANLVLRGLLYLAPGWTA